MLKTPALSRIIEFHLKRNEESPVAVSLSESIALWMHRIPVDKISKRKAKGKQQTEYKFIGV